MEPETGLDLGDASGFMGFPAFNQKDLNDKNDRDNMEQSYWLYYNKEETHSITQNSCVLGAEKSDVMWQKKNGIHNYLNISEIQNFGAVFTWSKKTLIISRKKVWKL